MNEREFFDNLAPHWDENEVLSTPSKVRYVLEKARIEKGQRVLDLGTGTGVLLPVIAEMVGPEGSITAVDFSTGMLEIAIRKFGTLDPTPQFLNMDFESETIVGTFDRILLYCVYPHLHEPIDTLKWLRGVNLEDGGIITIAFPCSESFINSIHRKKHADSDVLRPAADLVAEMVVNGLDARLVQDDDDFYIINIYK